MATMNPFLAYQQRYLDMHPDMMSTVTTNDRYKQPPFTHPYEHCDLQELRALILERTGDQRRPRNKKKCLEKLKHLDRNSPFRFLDLSGELRNAIYERALYYNNDFDIFDYRDEDEYDPQRPHVDYADTELLRTCRQIYNEVRGILYGQSRFMEIHENWVEKGIPPQLHALRHVQLIVPYENGMHSGLVRCALEMVVEAFNEKNALSTFKLSIAPGFAYIVWRNTSQFDPLKSLPEATQLTLCGIPQDREERIRKRIGREVKFAWSDNEHDSETEDDEAINIGK